MALEPEVMYVLTTVGGYLAGAATSWWVQNRGKVVDSLQEAAADAIDKIEETTGIDVPDSIEDAIDEAVEDVVDRVEDAVEDAADAAEDAIEAGDLEAALRDADAAVVMVAHDRYRTFPLEKIRALLRTPVLVDGRHVFDPQEAARCGLLYRCVGIGVKARSLDDGE